MGAGGAGAAVAHAALMLGVKELTIFYQVPEGVTRLGLTSLRQVMSIGLRDWAHRF